MAGPSNRILHIVDAPIAFKGFPVIAAKAGAAAIIDLQHRVTPAGKELHLAVERSTSLTGRTAMNHHNHRRLTDALVILVLRAKIQAPNLASIHALPADSPGAGVNCRGQLLSLGPLDYMGGPEGDPRLAGRPANSYRDQA